MYDKGKIITGLVIFVLLITFPIWYNHGDSGAVPTRDPNLPKDRAQAQEMVKYVTLPNDLKHPPAEEMRANHMMLFKSIHANADAKLAEQKGKKMPTMTCFGCHSKKQQFCDSCHAYAAVKTPDCWSCHQQ
ncbi:MAG: cytochrome C [Candidatus Electrothrix sp. Rat3]|nr:cytochrome C [Candidatus Electrothrix rattekaaiensis]